MVKALEKLVEFPVRWSDLDGLTTDQKAFLAIVSYAASEFNILRRLYLFASHETTDEDQDILFGTTMQRLVVLRTWSAKLFELSQTVEKLSKENGTSDLVVQRVAKSAWKSFEDTKLTDGYKIARNVRHEATNHYSMDAAKRNLPFVPSHANCGLFMHEKDGNSFYPMGEEVMFMGRMNRSGSSLKTDEERAEQLNLWARWNLDATRWSRELQRSIDTELLFDHMPGRSGKQKVYWFDPELVGGLTGRRVPLFLRTEPK